MRARRSTSLAAAQLWSWQTAFILAVIAARLMPVGRSTTTQYKFGMSTYIPRASTVNAKRSPSRSRMVFVLNGGTSRHT
jgi:hypothetical protein